MDNDIQKFKPDNKSGRPNKGLSRRGFLKGAGLTTVGTVALQTGVLGSALPEESLADKSIGPDATLIKLNVNGRVRSLAVEPRILTAGRSFL